MIRYLISKMHLKKILKMKNKTLKIILEVVKVVVSTLLGYLEGSQQIFSSLL